MSKLGIALRTTYPVNFSCAQRCALTTFRKKMRFSSQSRSCGNGLRALFLYFKLATLQPELSESSSRTIFVLKTCDFVAGAAGVRFAFGARLHQKHSANLTRTSAYPRPCQQKMHFCFKKKRLARGFLKKHSANLPTVSCQQKNANGTITGRTRQPAPPFRASQSRRRQLSAHRASDLSANLDLSRP